MNFNLAEIQRILAEMNFDGWLFYDFRGSNDLARQVLCIPQKTHLTRRFYYFVPKTGIPTKIVNAIEAFALDHLPGEKICYSSHGSLTDSLRKVLTGKKTIAMEYSPMNAIPYISRVDAGTIELVCSMGVQVKSSCDLISMFAARWSRSQFEENKKTASDLYAIVQKAFDHIASKVKSGEKISEYDGQQFISAEFKKGGYFTDSEPIVAVNENAANPHYEPTKEVHKEIRNGDNLLIDLWMKPNKPDGVWADITWVGFLGENVPQRTKEIADVVFRARDAAFELVKDRFSRSIELRGYEVDDAARKIIEDAGFGEYFVHRTGHSISTDIHGSGAHMDNYETRDERLVLPGTSFSIEPGIYIPGEIGIRSEIDVFVTEDGEVIQTGGQKQMEVPALL